MSRHEEKEIEELIVWRVLFFEKTLFLLRVTVMREGMSGCEV